MAREIEPEIATTLQADIQQLRADFAKLTTHLGGIAGDGVQSIGERTQVSAEKAWDEVKRQANQLSHGIEERPFTSALASFAAGVVLGMLLNGRRG